MILFLSVPLYKSVYYFQTGKKNIFLVVGKDMLLLQTINIYFFTSKLPNFILFLYLNNYIRNIKVLYLKWPNKT